MPPQTAAWCISQLVYLAGKQHAQQVTVTAGDARHQQASKKRQCLVASGVKHALQSTAVTPATPPLSKTLRLKHKKLGAAGNVMSCTTLLTTLLLRVCCLQLKISRHLTRCDTIVWWCCRSCKGCQQRVRQRRLIALAQVGRSRQTYIHFHNLCHTYMLRSRQTYMHFTPSMPHARVTDQRLLSLLLG